MAIYPPFTGGGGGRGAGITGQGRCGADAERGVHVSTLIVDLLSVGFAVAVGVLEDQNSVALRPLVIAGMRPVVNHLTDPNPAPMINVNVCWAENLRL